MRVKGKQPNSAGVGKANRSDSQVHSTPVRYDCVLLPPAPVSNALSLTRTRPGLEPGIFPKSLQVGKLTRADMQLKPAVNLSKSAARSAVMRQLPLAVT